VPNTAERTEFDNAIRSLIANITDEHGIAEIKRAVVWGIKTKVVSHPVHRRRSREVLNLMDVDFIKPISRVWLPTSISKPCWTIGPREL